MSDAAARAGSDAVSLANLALPASRWRRWRWQYGLACLGGGIVLAWVLVAVLAPLLAPYPPNAVDVTIRLLPMSAQHWLG